jgi:phage terminase small subunit
MLPIRPVTKKSPVLSPEFRRHMCSAENLQKATLAERKLTWKQKRFIWEYLADPERNATRAAVRAGYKSVDVHELLTHPRIRPVLEEENRKTFQSLEVTRERVIQEMATIAFSNLSDFLVEDPKRPGEFMYDVSNISREQAATLRDYHVDEQGRARISLHDKMAALQTLGKWIKLEEPATNKTVVSISLLDTILAGEEQQVA